ncbi:type II secretion system protein GspG [Myxococcus landrumensis]|uniref:Type II secretion system protein GspG n=1 Tax=Myxococcus landrumensis TaxID=2813577 RepID=A0ABX7MZR5_9BACT|nr:type II secretion system protein GspG [Myxococcus landrumus]QSQ11679.1 type II secretion system protein GspG [Myxococcus landrumus]
MNATPARRPLVPVLKKVLMALFVITPPLFLLGLGFVPCIDVTRADVARLDLQNLRGALRLYQERTGQLPTSEEGIRHLVEQGALEDQPRDPWGQDYRYSLRDGTLELRSQGADGLPGGDGDDEDIVLRCDVAPVTQALLRCEPNPPARGGPP